MEYMQMSESAEQCFICLQTEELISHCRCSLKVHRECFSRFIETQVDRQMKCSVCNHVYQHNVKKYTKTFAFNLIMLLLSVLLVNQISLTVYFGVLYQFGIVINSILSYILLTFYIALACVYRRQTNTWKWWEFGRIILEAEVCTTNDFSITLKQKDTKGCGCVTINNTDVCFKFRTIQN